MTKYLKQNKLVLVYILIMALAFTNRYVDIKVNPIIQYILSLLVIIIAIFHYNKNNKDTNNVIKFIIKFYLIPTILIHVYSLLMTMIGIFDMKYLCTNISAYMPILLAISSIVLFKEKAFKYSLISIFISWMISILISFTFHGTDIFVYAIMQGYFNYNGIIGSVSKNYLELHDIVLTMGMIFIYYILFVNNKNKYTLIAMILIIFLGLKRISILGILMSLTFYYIFTKYEEKRNIKISKYTKIILVISCYAFVYLIMESAFINVLMTKFNIRLMSRNYYFEEIAKFGEFSPFFLGLGRSSVTKILTGDLAYLRVGAVHSDLLKMYIENGFVIFGLWLLYYIVQLPKIYFNKIGKKSVLLYMCIMLYTFALYLTDNVENYFVYQYFFIIIPITYSIKEINKINNFDYFDLNQQKVLFRLRNKINRILAVFLFYVFRIFKIKNNKIIIINYHGKGYGDNAKAIVEQLLKKNNFDIVWSVKNINEKLPKEIRKVKIYSIKWIYELATSAIWINNSRFEPYIRKRKGQYYIQTWHSSLRLKKIEMDAKDELTKYYHKAMKNDSKMIDLMISGSDFSYNIYANSFLYNGEIKKFGTPRCDIFYQDDIKNKLYLDVRKELKINKNQEIILYAPTFRKYTDELDYLMDFNKILETDLFKEKDVVFLFRAHPSQKIDFPDHKECIDVTNYPDMQKLICACDYLVTDYSGCCFDAMMADKKCILLTKDYDEYMSKERKFYFELGELPFEWVSKESELVDKILNFDKQKYEKNITKFLDKIGLYENGKASENLAKHIEGMIENEKV